MQKTTILIGPQGSGKTERAKQLSSGKRAVFIDASQNSYRSKFFWKDVTRDTECIVIDQCNIDSLNALVKMLINDEITVNTKSESFIMEKPNVIICSQQDHYILPSGIGYQKRFNVIMKGSVL